jgi:hypothetical protein
MGLGIRTACRRTFRSALFALGYHVAPQTDTATLITLLRKLRPRDCGIDLIRVGSEHDGGYLIPDDLEAIEYCFSPGVNTSVDFESQLADRGIKSFLADYSVTSPPILRAEFTFDRMFLGPFDKGHWFTLSTWKDKYLSGYQGELILQMDIEGFEYETILTTPLDVLRQFRILIIEFHGMDRLFDSFMFARLSSCFEKLLELFHVVHIHPNNSGEAIVRGEIEIPEMMEFTFLNKSRVKEATPAFRFPHQLDRDNSLTARRLVLADCWHSHCEANRRY